MDSFYADEELASLGLKICGNNVKISKKASFYGSNNISIGNNVRIDDFCILSGRIEIGNYVHIAAYTAIYGDDAGVYINDFANISSRVCIYAVSDDYSGYTLTSPLISDKYKNVKKGKVIIYKHTIIGTGSTVLPNVVIGEGGAFGAMSLITKDTEPFGIYAGIPAKKIKDRQRNLLALEREFIKDVE